MRLNLKVQGLEAALPTEAQWEYACRAGTTGPYAGRSLDAMAWYDKNAIQPHAVKTKQPNAWGLYDMHGNVWQWCADWYGSYPLGGMTTDPTGPATGILRVFRGGGWASTASFCRAACRNENDPGVKLRILGLRICVPTRGPR